MKKPLLTRNEALILVIITLAVTIVGSLAINAYLTKDHHWRRIVAPTNERAVEILAVNRLLRAYVRTDQGNLYLCGGSTWRDTCEPVTAAEVPAFETPGKWSNCTTEFPATPPLAGTVVDEIQVGQCFEGKTYSKLVLLSDGTMWQWLRTYSWVYGFALATGTGISLVLGALLGWLVVWLRWYLREPAPVAPTGGGAPSKGGAPTKSGTTSGTVH